MRLFNIEIGKRRERDVYTGRSQGNFVSRWARPPSRNTEEWLAAFSTSPRLEVVDRIASDLAGLKGRLFRINEDGTEKEISVHPFLDFMARPNPLYEMTGSAVWRLHEIYLMLVGESYMLVERDSSGFPLELWNVPPHWVKMTPYLGNPTYTILSPGGLTMTVPVDDMFVMKQLNPLDPFMRGLGIAESIADEVEIDEYAAKFQKRFFYNDATPPVVFIMPDATDEQRETFMARWNKKHKGVENSHRAAAVSGNVTVHEVGKGEGKNLGFLESRVAMRDAVLEHFGMPREIMGITENSNRATADAAQYIYAKNVLTPRISMREEAINTQLLPMFGDGLVWRYDPVIPYDKAFDKEKALDAYKEGLITKNEARGLMDYPAVEGGDVFRMPDGCLFLHEGEDPVEVMRELMVSRLIPENASGIAVQGQANISGKGRDLYLTRFRVRGSHGGKGHAEKTGNQEAEGQNPGGQDLNGQNPKGQKPQAQNPKDKECHGHKFRDQKAHAPDVAAMLRSEDRAAEENAKLFKAAVMKHFRSQQAKIVAVFGTKAKDDPLSPVADYIQPDGTLDQEKWAELSEAEQRRLAGEVASGILDWKGKEARNLVELLRPLWEKSCDDGAGITAEYYGVFAIKRPDFVEKAKKYCGKRVVGIEETTRDNIADIISRGISDGMGQARLKKAIREEMGSRATEARAKLIARQETMTALATGQFDMMKAAGATTKTWHHRDQKDPRDGKDGKVDHIQWEGTTVGIDEKFPNGLRFPRDPEDSRAEEVINCRCYLTYGFDADEGLKPATQDDIMGADEGQGRTPLTVEQVRQDMTAQVEALPEEQKQALQNYTGFAATRINNAISHGKITPAIQKEINLLDAALKDGVMPEAMVLHRDTVLSFLGLGLPDKPTKEELSKIVRHTITNSIFTSTSFEDLRLPGRDTELWLNVPAGYRGCQYLEPVAFSKFENQEEILFARGLRYRVTDAKIENGKYVLFAEVLE